MRNQFEIWKEWNKLSYEVLEELSKLEYNTDTSIPHLNKSEDIVRSTCITNEDVEIIG